MSQNSPPKSGEEESIFHWTREPEFIPPVQDGGLEVCMAQELTPSDSGDMQTLLNAFLENVLNFIDARAAVVRALLPDEQTLKVISALGLNQQELEVENLIELACEECSKDAFRHGLCSTDIKNCEVRNETGQSRQLRSVISIPLYSRNNSHTLLGRFSLFFDTPHSSSGNIADKASSFAELLATMIEFAKANREAKRAEVLMERQFIANEIHDSLAQTINYARMSTSLLTEAVHAGNKGRTAQLTHDIDEALEIGQKAVRSLITDFRGEIHPAGLLHAIQELCSQFRQKYDIALDCSIRIADIDLPLEYELQTFHIVQEALSNIAKHSNASHARVFVEYILGYYVFTVEDNGIGTFSPLEGHYGITIMRERAQRIGGELRVESTKGLGTSLQLYFPEPEVNWRTIDE